jgi:hypothetical protein
MSCSYCSCAKKSTHGILKQETNGVKCPFISLISALSFSLICTCSLSLISAGFPTDTPNLEPTIQHHHPNPASHRHPRFPRFHLMHILLDPPRLLVVLPMVRTHRSDLHGLTRLTIRSILTDPKEPLLFPCQLPHLRSPHPRFLSPLPP